MKVRDEHAILRGLEDFRIAGAMEPETPESMRQRKLVHEAVERERRWAEDRQRMYDLEYEYAERERQRLLDLKVEALKRGEVYEPPKPQPLPAEVVCGPSYYGPALSASGYPSASGVVYYHGPQNRYFL
jgi:hypothetical protein